MNADTPKKNLGLRLLRWFGLFALSYLLGIAACVMLTVAEFELAGVNLLPWYLGGAVIGLILIVILLFQEPGSVLAVWPIWLVLLAPFVIETVLALSRKPGVRRLGWFRACWIGFPIGFIGTFGIYIAGSMSI